jgi:adenylate cyclase
MATDFEKEGLLEGLDGPARQARQQLLETLAESGVDLDELREATEEGRLALLPVERLIGGEECYSFEELVELSGLDAGFLERMWRALGLAVSEIAERRFTDADLAAARRVKAFRGAGLSEEHILEISRVMSRSMANVAATIGTVFIDTYLQPGDNERDLALRYAEISRELIPMLGPVLEHVLRIQQLALIRQAAIDSTVLEAGHLPGWVQMTVCFADLVGFTKLGEMLDPVEIGQVAERLEVMAADVATGPVRLIKTIGDAVMLASPDADALLESAVQLVRAADEAGEGFPQLRAGVAYGDALERGGDWYGRPVNLASRVTGRAYPASVLATAAVKEAATESKFSWSFAGKRKLKGVDDDVALFRVRRVEHPAQRGS